MIMTEIIAKKRDGHALSTEEIEFFIEGYTKGTFPDYQASALLMAIVIKGMTTAETHALTMAMLKSGDVMDLSSIHGIKADKHSTGGVGDKTSIALLPMIAANGVKMAKMSGRGLGFTGGTIDKLESFPGFSCEMSEKQFTDRVNNLGLAIASQTGQLVPADKKLYALRDVTGTVESIPLIVSSIMSKKLAAGADVIVLDVKCGSGAFMKTLDDARELAKEMVEVGKLAGRKTVACITEMSEPLGAAVGNALEIKEAIALLKGEVSGNLRELCLTLGACILTESGAFENHSLSRAALIKGIEDGSALTKLADMVEAQGGERESVYNTELLPKANTVLSVVSDMQGYISEINAGEVGMVSMQLGGGRATKESEIDLSVGIVLRKKVGDRVDKGEILAEIHAKNEEEAKKAAKALLSCYKLSATAPEKVLFIKEIIR